MGNFLNKILFLAVKVNITYIKHPDENPYHTWDFLSMIESPESLENMPAHKGGRDYYFEGLALGREGRHEEAILAFSGALSVDPDNSRAWVGRGFTLGKLGRYEEEIECCEKAIALDPGC